MRQLTSSELLLVAGGDFTWWGPRPDRDWLERELGVGDLDDAGSSYGSRDDGGTEIVVTAPSAPSPCVANQVTVTIDGLLHEIPNGATYYAPEDWTNEDFVRTVAFLAQFASSSSAGLGSLSDHWASDAFEDRLRAFLSVYTEPSDPNFIDFKDWGTPAGPEGSISGGLISYFSPAEGATIVTSPFEAFGNFIFGYMAGVAGFSNFETRIIAAVAQGTSQTTISGIVVEILVALVTSGEIPEDDPRDDPHVRLGFDANYLFSNAAAGSIVNFIIQNCPDNGSGNEDASSGSPSLSNFSQDRPLFGSGYRAQ